MYFVTFRNRLIELHKYVLPLDQSGRKTVQPLSYSTREFEYMRRNQTLDLPPNWVHKVVRKTNEARTATKVVWNRFRRFMPDGTRQSTQPAKSPNIRDLQFRGHLLSKDVFPHNVLLMKNKTVVFATKFRDSLDLGSDDTYVIGHQFELVSLFM